VLYIQRIAEPDYAEEGTLLAKRPDSPDGDSALPDVHDAGLGRPVLRAARAGPQPAELIAGLSPRAEQVLIAISVFREPADRNALVFQLGQHDWTAARAPDRRGPAPPYQPPADLTELLTACTAAGLLLHSAGEQAGTGECWRVDPWIAGDLQQRLTSTGRQAELAAAHRRAAEYWQWRAAAWPQDRRSDLHDLLEARHHLFGAGDAEQGSEVTQVVCAQLHAWGDLGREAELIQSTLDLLPSGSVSRASWMHELGAIHQVRGEHDEAYRCYGSAVQMFAILGEYRGVARGQHSLGVLAQAQGDYRRAERHYRRSSAAEEKARPAESEPQASPAAPGLGVPPPDEIPPAGQVPGPGQVPAAGQVPPSVRPPAPAGRDGRPDTTTIAQAAQSVQPPQAVQTAQSVQVPHAPVFKPARPSLVPAAALPRTPARGGATRTHAARERQAVPAPRARPAAVATDAPGQPRRTASRRLRRRSVLILCVAALGLAALTIAGIGAALARPAGPAGGNANPVATAATARTDAAAWVASQVSSAAVVACDPAMCADLRQRGVPAGDLLALGPNGPADPLASNVVVATAAVRDEFGARLASVYAPLILARFGTGSAAIQVRVVAPDGAPAYLRAARADLAARRGIGAEMAHNGHLVVSGRARAELTAGLVDSRLLATLATLADMETLRVLEFGDAGPGASAAVPMRSAEITAANPAVAASWLRAALRFLAAQQPPFQPSAVRQLSAGHALLVQYSTPSPLGLLSAPGTSPGA
jgi:tetratricopeptide (TPR) repeat protein